MRILFAVVISMLIFSCGSKVEDLKTVPDNQLILSGGLRSTSDIDISTPDLFEKSPPTSSILRSSLIMFEDGYERIFTDNGVVAIATDDKVIAILKQQYILLNITECSSLLTDSSYQQIAVYKNFLAIANRSNVSIYSISDCAKVATYTRSAFGGIAIIDNFFIEYQATTILLRNLFNGSLILSVNMDIPIVGVLKLKDRLSILHTNGYVTYYDKKVNSFVLEGSIDIPFTELKVASGKIYGRSDKSEFFILSDEGLSLSNEFNCRLSSLSVTAKCGGTLIYDGKRYPGIDRSDSNFLVANGLYIELDDNVMNIFNLSRGYQRYIAFNYKLPQPCLTAKGTLYFTDFSGDNILVNNGAEQVVKSIPKSCNSKSARLTNGTIYCNNKRCYQFAREVYQDNSSKVYRRNEGKKVYFYFENK